MPQQKVKLAKLDKLLSEAKEMLADMELAKEVFKDGLVLDARLFLQDTYDRWYKSYDELQELLSSLFDLGVGIPDDVLTAQEKLSIASMLYNEVHTSLKMQGVDPQISEIKEIM